MALSLPLRCLLAVLRAQPDPEFPLGLVTELDARERAELFRRLHQHGLSGWAHRLFADAAIGLPSDLAEPLRSAHLQNTARSVLALAAYGRISRILSDAGVEHIPLKGIRFLETLYPDPGTRHLSDIDVLVRMKDVECADAALRKAGLRREDEARFERQQRLHHHHGYGDLWGFDGELELHWGVSSSYGFGHSTDRLWDDARAAAERGQSGLERELPPPLHLHSLLVHTAQHGYAMAAKWIIDLRLLLELTRFVGAGHGLAALAARYHSRSPCFFVLKVVERLGGSRPAAELARGLRPGALRAVILAALASPELFFRPNAMLHGKWAQYGLRVGLNDRLRDQAHAALNAVLYKLDVERIRFLQKRSR